MKKITALVVTFLIVGVSFAQTVRLDRDTAFYIYLKGSQTVLTPKDELNYAKSFENLTYRKYKNDEFEWDEQFTKIKQSLKEKIHSVDMDVSYIVMTDVKLENYDFTNEGFPVSISEKIFFPYDHFDNWASLDSDSILDKRIALKLDRFEKYNFIAMPKVEAKKFLQTRKNTYGNVNRQVSLQVTFKIAEFDSEEYKSFANIALSNDYLPVVGIIEKVEVYDTSNSYNVEKIGELMVK